MQFRFIKAYKQTQKHPYPYLNNLFITIKGYRQIYPPLVSALRAEHFFGYLGKH